MSSKVPTVSTGLYSGAALLAVTPFCGAITDPTEFRQEFPLSLIEIVILGLGFYTTTVPLFIIGYNRKHRTAEPNTGTGSSDTTSTR